MEMQSEDLFPDHREESMKQETKISTGFQVNLELRSKIDPENVLSFLDAAGPR